MLIWQIPNTLILSNLTQHGKHVGPSKAIAELCAWAQKLGLQGESTENTGNDWGREVSSELVKFEY